MAQETIERKKWVLYSVDEEGRETKIEIHQPRASMRWRAKVRKAQQITQDEAAKHDAETAAKYKVEDLSKTEIQRINHEILSLAQPVIERGQVRVIQAGLDHTKNSADELALLMGDYDSEFWQGADNDIVSEIAASFRGAAF